MPRRAVLWGKRRYDYQIGGLHDELVQAFRAIKKVLPPRPHACVVLDEIGDAVDKLWQPPTMAEFAGMLRDRNDRRLEWMRWQLAVLNSNLQPGDAVLYRDHPHSHVEHINGVPTVYLT